MSWSGGLARSRSHAQAMINAGEVIVDGSVVERPGEQVASSAAIHAPDDRYVSRGAHKLIGALDDLQLSVAGRALDAGASTGGFTQVLLARGCQEVIAIDVGSGQLAPVLSADPRVRHHERINLRDRGSSMSEEFSRSGGSRRLLHLTEVVDGPTRLGHPR